MNEEVASEKLSIRSSARSLKKYGSTSSHVKQPVNVIKHAVQTGDTLQGLALRYGVTTEQIRRTNRLWASDSLFLREYLMIPADGESSTLNNGGCSEPSLSRIGSMADEDDEATIDEFLGKIDSSIASTRNEVRKCQGNSEFLSELNGRERRRPAVARLRQSHANNNVLVVSNSRQVRTSLQNMERQQDEMFEL